MSYLYPYGDTQQLNLSWFLAKFKELYEYIMNLDPDDIALATVLSRFTNEYNSSTNYIPGDYVIHEGFIYKANQSTTGNFNPQAWDAALPINDIQGLRILLGGISTDLANLEQNAVTNLQYTPGAATADGLLRQTKNGAASTVMTVDKEPTANSQNPVKSGAVRAELTAISDAVTDEQNARENADTSMQDQIDDLNNITGDGSLSGFTATDLTGAANELKGSLNTNESAIAIVANGNTHAAVASGQYVYIKNHSMLAEGLYKATTAIPLNDTLSSTNVAAVSNGGINDLDAAIKYRETNIIYPLKDHGTWNAVLFGIGIQIDSNRIYCMFNLPFFMKDFNYSVNLQGELIRPGFTSVPLANLNVDSKFNNVINVIAQSAGTAGVSYPCRLTMSISYD